LAILGISTVAIEIATGRRTKKENGFEKKIWSRHHSYSGKLWKTIKIRQVCEKTRFWIRESVTRREGVSTLPRPPEGGTFNLKRKVDVIFKMLIFFKNNETKNMLKRNKNIF